MPTLLIITDGRTHISSQSLEWVTHSLGLNYHIIDFNSDIDNLLFNKNECYLIYNTNPSKSAYIINKLNQYYFILQFPLYHEIIKQEINYLDSEIIPSKTVNMSTIEDLITQKIPASYDFRKRILDKVFINIATRLKAQCSTIEEFCDEYLGKQNPTLLISSRDLNSEYYQHLRWFSKKINMKLSVIGQTTIFNNKDYLILNNQIGLPNKAQFKRNLYGHQIQSFRSDISYVSFRQACGSKYF